MESRIGQGLPEPDSTRHRAAGIEATFTVTEFRATDIHTHFVPEHLPALPHGSGETSWPSMAPGKTCCHRHVMVKGDIYRVITDQCWDASRRIAEMQTMGVTRQVISPMPELLSYWMDAKDAAVLHRDLNEQMARLVQAHPQRFSALAAVPLQDVDTAIAELEYAATVLKMAGAEIGSNINDRPIGAPEFEPFFAAAERLGMAIFVHAIRPAGMNRLIGPPVLQQTLGFPNEIGFAAASAITTNLITRYPNLKIAFSHGGGSLAMLLPRLQHAWQHFPALHDKIDVAPIEQARKLFYDTLVYDRDTLEFLLRRFGPDALLVGTDYPFSIMEQDPVGRLRELGLAPALLAQLCHENAARFLSGAGLKEHLPPGS